MQLRTLVLLNQLLLVQLGEDRVGLVEVAALTLPAVELDVQQAVHLVELGQRRVFEDLPQLPRLRVALLPSRRPMDGEVM
jgi:hypothetical protein